MAAAVRSSQAIADPDGSLVIYCPKLQHQPLTRLQRRDLDRPAIPCRTIEARVGDAACSRLRRERHDDRRVPIDVGGAAPGPGTINGKVPGTVKVDPVLALELRSGVGMFSHQSRRPPRVSAMPAGAVQAAPLSKFQARRCMFVRPLTPVEGILHCRLTGRARADGRGYRNY